MFSFFSKRTKKNNKNRKPSKAPARRSLRLEYLEDRSVLSAFSVVNLNDHGQGSLRQAMLDANSHIGADTIDLDIAGTIKLTSGALPTLTGQVDIDGSTAPGFAGTPVVQIDFNNYAGLKFNSASSVSTLASLGLVDAKGSAVIVNGGGGNTIIGNYIGVNLNGTTVEANRGSGVELVLTTGNTIGGDDPTERNVISGNKLDGVRLSGATGNEISGNYIGTDATGTLDRGNKGNGVNLTNSSFSNTVDGNVISGNDTNGVLIGLRSDANTVSDNLIGLAVDGVVALGNSKDGVKLDGAGHNVIGHDDPVTSITYYDALSLPTQPVSGWQGLRGASTAGQYVIAGTSGLNALVYQGPIDGIGGQSFTFLFLNSDGTPAYSTSAYSAEDLGSGVLRIVGSYRNSDYETADVAVNGFLFEGTTADLSDPTHFRTIDYGDAVINFIHSTMGGLVVGNYNTPTDGTSEAPLGPGHAFIYDIDSNSFLTEIIYPGSVNNTAYGIWHNGGTSYTIVGGYAYEPVNDFDAEPLGYAFMVDYDSDTNEFTHWTTFRSPQGANFATHFEGISSVEEGVYTLSGEAGQIGGNGHLIQGSWVQVRRNPDGSFGPATWVDLAYTDGTTTYHGTTSSDSVYGNQVVGIVVTDSGVISYQATVNIGFQLSNVISGNGGNGIGLYGASDNVIAMNYIGTDLTGTLDRGNAVNGILMTNSSARNLIGGEATGGNNPTNDAFVRPPQGNLISGNNANGVLITGKSTENQLSGNFIGTGASGNTDVGNTLDGVAIVSANKNSLIGCTFQQDPFVFYNVISGNNGNGLRIKDSNDTQVQANIMGIGADNLTSVGNSLNGLLVEGSSARTDVGGPIPLGNVIAANGQNGIYVKDTASYFTSYNTFCGLAAFSDDPTLGNALDGMLITSSGAGILIRTNVVTRNGDDGIELSGKAKGVNVIGNIIGLNTEGLVPMGNLGNGVEIGGSASNILVGGEQHTFNIIPHNAISSNGGHGVAIVGTAHNVTVNHGMIGLDLYGDGARPNGGSGVYIGSGTYSNTIGSTAPNLKTVISANTSNGVTITGSKNNRIVGAYIGTDATGTQDRGNGGSGVDIVNSSTNVIGGTATGAGNIIAFNDATGVFVESGSGNAVRQNSIYGNTSLGIDLLPGANNNQAAPLLTSLQTISSGIQVTGTLTSKPSTTFTIEFFANAAAGASGRYFLGSLTVKTNSSGLGAFTFLGPALPGGTSFVTATTTAASGTSEFSNSIS